jgi:predicted MFS family arabinose efflux permease
MTTHAESTQTTFRSWLGVAVVTASLFTFVTIELMPIGLLIPVSSKPERVGRNCRSDG